MKTLLRRALTAPHTYMPVTVARKVIRRANCNNQSSHNDKQLLVDISEIIRHDVRTGIQRVVRGILLQLFNNPTQGYVVRPVFSTVKHGYRYAEITAECLQADEAVRAKAKPVVVCNGDIFLGLDLAAHLLPRHQGELTYWKRRGVRLAFLVYDILPVLHPHWFNPKRYRTFSRWLRTLAIHADDLVCISNTVKSDLSNWLLRRYRIKTGAIRLHTIPLGANIETTMPSTGLALHHQAFLLKMNEEPFILMVGTLEPRKGYEHVLDAFELLWQQGCNIYLVIAGRPGWKTEPLQQRLRSHAERNRRLFWFEDASDELLHALYGSTRGVIMASEAEGFGLPLVEAMHFGKPVLARDIPVFREIGGNGLSYFHESSKEQFASIITSWLNLIPENVGASNDKMPFWSDTANSLLYILNCKSANTSSKLIL